MKWLKAYTSFSRTERTGIIALLGVLVILLVIRLTMQLWVKPDLNEAEQKRLQAAWAQFKNPPAAKGERVEEDSNQPIATEIPKSKIAEKPVVSGSLFAFDPNTIDSAGLRRLGLKEKTTTIFLHWRAKGKHFYKKEDMKGVYTLTDEEYQRIAPYIRIRQEPHKWE